MLPFSRLLLLLVPLSVVGQVYTATGVATTTSTSSAPAATQSIQVGAVSLLRSLHCIGTDIFT